MDGLDRPPTTFRLGSRAILGAIFAPDILKEEIKLFKNVEANDNSRKFGSNVIFLNSISIENDCS